MKRQYIKDYQKFSNIALRASWIMLLLLILNLAINHLLVGIDSLFRILVSCVPLMLFIPGLLKARRRSASLLCFALLLYFIVFVSKISAPGNMFSEIISTTLTILLFISSMMFSTWQYRADLERLEKHSSGESGI